MKTGGTTRKVAKVLAGRLTSDGAGVSLRRSIGTEQLGELDPFLLLDEFGSTDPNDYIGGFPPHPHRGFETVTYMIDGEFKHQDSAGHAGVLSSGGVQWMTAGSGIIHSEMPIRTSGKVRGFQLWLNLPAKNKMLPPRYQNIPPESIPSLRPADGGLVKIIAGEYAGVRGPVEGVVTEPLYLDVMLDPGEPWETTAASELTLFAYPFEGGGTFAPSSDETSSGHIVLFGQGEKVSVRAGNDGCRFILVGAKPLGEPVARYGPFVMNTPEEIKQAMEDYRNGAFGKFQA